MDYSDSDSGGSHISSTPPRHPKQPPPSQLPPSQPPPPPPPPTHTLLFSDKHLKNPKSKSKFKSTFSREIIKIKPPKRKSKPPVTQSEPQIERTDPIEPPIDPISSSSNVNLGLQINSNLKSQILRSDLIKPTFDPISSLSSSHFEILPAGISIKPKFTKYSARKDNLNFESTEKVIVHCLESKTEGTEDSKCVNETEDGNVNGKKLGKVVTKHPNLIGSSVYPQVTVNKPKVVKGVNEGNFIRLNINGHGGRKKFGYKVRKKNSNAYTGKCNSYKRSKRKLKSGSGGLGDEERSLCEEESLRFEERNESETRLDDEVIEQAVLDVRNEKSDENLVKLLKITHGYDSFRNGQLEAIKLILDGKSSMVILPTGAGKSLCYQLPALVLEGMTLVISPLVALMFDQLKQLPPVIPGGLLCSSQTLEESLETLRRVQEGALKVLFVSPERLLNAEFTSIVSENSLISLVVIDEAHCISEWSHNFRPSYMRLRASILRSSLGVDCILAMTATATTKTMQDVMSSLEIPPTNLIQSAQIRDNLQLSVSLSENRMKDLMALIKASPYTEIKSIIIYCKYQSETDMISKFLCDSNIKSKSYHGGIPAKDRRRTQELFCSNKIRVIVATVAFGMGLDKRDVGAVIHYSLPESLEEYVQEIGRSGRDGRLSYCHLFFDDTTYFKLRSLMYSEGVDQYTINKFISQVFNGDSNSQGTICSLVKESASRKFDMKEEVILTILTRLELAEMQYLRLLPQMSVTCVLNFHMTSPPLLAVKDFVIAAILKKSEIKDGQYVFDIPTVACSIGTQAFTVTNQLQILKSKGEITYELKDPAYCYTIVNFPKDICSLAADLAKWLSEVESCKVRKVDSMFNAAAFAVKTCDRTNGCSDSQHTHCLQKKISDYFNATNDNNVPDNMGQTSRFLRADIKVFLQSNSHTKFTPRAIARIMHGIASPTFPASVWSKTHFWGRYIQTNFDVIIEAAKAELIASVGKSAV